MKTQIKDKEQALTEHRFAADKFKERYSKEGGEGSNKKSLQALHPHSREKDLNQNK